MNVDYKILEKVLANRMKTVLDKIIHVDQKGFMSSRKIAANICKICDLITYCNTHDIAAQITSYDFPKAFDRVTYDCLFSTLKHFNFGPKFIQWTKRLYTDFGAVVQNNGYFSNTINIQRGVHHSRCCSSFYFLLCAETLANELRNDPQVKWIPIGAMDYLLGLFADDMDNYMPHDGKSFFRTLSVIQKFGTVSGLTLNYDKTTVYRIGSIKNTQAMFYTQPQLAWTNDPINILGVQVCCNELTMTRINYQGIFNKVQETLSSWTNRTLSLYGTVVNSLVGSLFVYKMAVLPFIPTVILSQLGRSDRVRIILRLFCISHISYICTSHRRTRYRCNHYYTVVSTLWTAGRGSLSSAIKKSAACLTSRLSEITEKRTKKKGKCRL